MPRVGLSQHEVRFRIHSLRAGAGSGIRRKTVTAVRVHSSRMRNRDAGHRIRGAGTRRKAEKTRQSNDESLNQIAYFLLYVHTAMNSFILVQSKKTSAIQYPCVQLYTVLMMWAGSCEVTLNCWFFSGSGMEDSVEHS